MNGGAMQAQALAAEGGHTRVNLHSLVDMHVVPLKDPQPAQHLQAGYNTLCGLSPILPLCHARIDVPYPLPYLSFDCRVHCCQIPFNLLALIKAVL
jgi:hypothetical protein